MAKISQVDLKCTWFWIFYFLLYILHFTIRCEVVCQKHFYGKCSNTSSLHHKHIHHKVWFTTLSVGTEDGNCVLSSWFFLILCCQIIYEPDAHSPGLQTGAKNTKNKWYIWLQKLKSTEIGCSNLHTIQWWRKLRREGILFYLSALRSDDRPSPTHTDLCYFHRKKYLYEKLVMFALFCEFFLLISYSYCTTAAVRSART